MRIIPYLALNKQQRRGNTLRVSICMNLDFLEGYQAFNAKTDTVNLAVSIIFNRLSINIISFTL